MRPPSPRAGKLLLLIAIASATGQAAADTIVDQCGEVYSGVGMLAADLDCSASADPAVRINDFGSLDLQGHTLTARIAVQCDARLPCDITSTGAPGNIVAGGSPFALGIHVLSDDTGLNVHNVAISGFYQGIVTTGGGTITMTDSSVSGCTESALRVIYNRVALENSHIVDNPGDGIRAASVRASDSEVSRNGGVGIDANKSILQRVTIADNGESGFVATFGPHRVKECEIVRNGGHGIDGGYYSTRMSIKDSMLDDNTRSGLANVYTVRARNTSFSRNGEAGIFQLNQNIPPSSIKLNDCTVTENGTFGVSQTAGQFQGLAARGSSLTGNSLDADCGTSIPCADIGSPVLPHVDSPSSCGTSYVHDSGIPGTSWGICSGD